MRPRAHLFLYSVSAGLYSVVFGLHTEYQRSRILRLYADLTQIASGIRSNCNIKRPIFSFSAAGWLS